MGKIKYIDKVMELFRKTPAVSTRDIKIIVRNDRYAYLLISNLLKQGKIKRITRGFYTIHEDPIVSIFCFRPCYIGLQEALSIHNIWEQETNTVIITAQTVNYRIKEILGNNVIFHRIKPKYMFGFELVEYSGFFVPVSDVEKTFIDFVYFNEIPEKKTLNIIKKRIDIKKLNRYLNKYPEIIRKRVQSLL